MSNEIIYPMVPIRGVVYFPSFVITCKIGRLLSILSLNRAIESDKTIFMATQHDYTIETPTPEQVYRIGVIGKVIHYEKLKDQLFKVKVEVLERGEAISIVQTNGWEAKVIKIDRQDYDTSKASELVAQLKQYITDNINIIEYKALGNIGNLQNKLNVSNISDFTYGVAASLNLSIEENQCILETISVVDRLVQVSEILRIRVEQS